MKKSQIVSSSLAVVFIAGMGGCSLKFWEEKTPTLEERFIDTGEEQVSPDETVPETVAIEGYVVKNEEKEMFDKGTHLLKDDSGKTISLLESDYEDLSIYEEEGKVEIKGLKEDLKDNDFDLITVETVQYLEIPASAKPTEYSSLIFGIQGELAPGWIFKEEAGKTSLFSNKKMTDPSVTIEEFALVSEEGAVFQGEMDNGTEISVGGKRSFRFLRGSTDVEIFVVNGTNILQISFSGKEEEKADFYNFLLSLKFGEEEDSEPVPCGGNSGYLCPEGYRCEFEDETAPDATGLCAKIDMEEPSEDLAPETPPEVVEEAEVPPEDERVTEETPEVESRIILEEEESSEVDAVPEDKAEKDEALVMEYIRSNIGSLAPEKPSSGSRWEVKLFSFSDGSIVSAEYEENDDETEKRKLLFTFTLDGDAVTLEEKGYFVPGEETDWELKSGESLQSGEAQELYTPEGEKKASLSEGYRLYESSHYQFSLEYPKDYYYSHVGSVNGSISTVVFSDTPATGENALFRIEILDGAQDKTVQSGSSVIIPRDDDSHFRITAEEGSSLVDLDHMADTLVSSL